MTHKDCVGCRHRGSEQCYLCFAWAKWEAIATPSSQHSEPYRTRDCNACTIDCINDVICNNKEWWMPKEETPCEVNPHMIRVLEVPFDRRDEGEAERLRGYVDALRDRIAILEVMVRTRDEKISSLGSGRPFVDDWGRNWWIVEGVEG